MIGGIRIHVEVIRHRAIGDQRPHRLPAPLATATATPCTHRQSKSIDSRGGGDLCFFSLLTTCCVVVVGGGNGRQSSLCLHKGV